MKASITLHIENLWSNRAELSVEVDLHDLSSDTSQEAIMTLFDTARLMAAEARAEDERALFGQEAINKRYRELDEREARLDERDKRVTARETSTVRREALAADRDAKADEREREQMEHDVRASRRD